MQYPNSNLSNNSPNKRRLIIVIILVILIIFLIIGLIFYSQRNKPDEINEYYDPGSGETVSDPVGKSPENFENIGKTPTYLGFSKLIDFGVTKYQEEGIKTAVTLYSRENNNFINESSITTSSIKISDYDDPNTLIRTAEFEMVINRKDKYQAKAILDGIKNVNVILSKDGKKVYESDFIDSTEYSPDRGDY